MNKYCRNCAYCLINGFSNTYLALLILCFFFVVLLVGCSAKPNEIIKNTPDSASPTDAAFQAYKIGPGDVINIFVWGNPDVSIEVSIRPDGKVSSPLVEDMVAIGKTPTQLARDIEKVLFTFIKQPTVTVIVKQFGGLYNQQIRVVGEASQPQGLPYREKMSLLDVMIAVNGLTEFAAGNKAKISRMVNGQKQVINVRLEDLLKSGDISANTEMRPGDILIIPESWF